MPSNGSDSSGKTSSRGDGDFSSRSAMCAAQVSAVVEFFIDSVRLLSLVPTSDDADAPEAKDAEEAKGDDEEDAETCAGRWCRSPFCWLVLAIHRFVVGKRPMMTAMMTDSMTAADLFHNTPIYLPT